MKWTEKDIKCGVIVAKKWQGGEKFYTPKMIGYHNAPGGQVVGLTCFRDGMFMDFDDGSRAALAEQLNKGGYIPIIKAQFKGDGDISAIENRLNLPAVVITNCDG